MKKTTLLSLVVASVLYTGCGEEAKKAVTDAATSATNTVKETASHAMDATKSKISEASKVVSEKVDAAKEVVSEEVTKAKEVAKAVTQREAANEETTAKPVEVSTNPEAPEREVADTSENAMLKAAFVKCAGCHGKDGKTKALGKSAVIAGQPASELATKISEYKAGTRNTSGMGTLMKGQVSALDDAMIKKLSEYISGL